MSIIVEKYRNIGKALKEDASSDKVTDLIRDLHHECIGLLSNYEKVPLISKVPEKKYFSFKVGDKLTRPINMDLFNEEITNIDPLMNILKKRGKASPKELTKICYSIAMSFCCSIDILKTRDQKTPGTFFEYFISHIFSKMLGVNPRKELEVLNLDMHTKLPTDFIFDLGTNLPKFHLPIKTSTRERVIQVWAHQRVLDGVYGTGRFIGILVSLAETKLDHKKLEVIEICLPEQWRLYQLFIAQMKRIYYLDIPKKYKDLNKLFPPIHVKPFGDFFYEFEKLYDIF